jgi:UDP-2,3-diacylglucosamine hydrolase
VAETLLPHFRALADSGTAILFMAGNRDFLLGDDYCRRAGIQRIEEPLALEQIQPRTLLMHGDALCTDDHEYQRFRAKVRNPAWQKKMLARPIWWRRAIAALARTISRWRNRNKSERIMDVNAEAVAECFRSHRIGRLIHGHTHRPAVHEVKVDGEALTRMVLGDWHGERGSLIRIEGHRAELLVMGRDDDGRIKLDRQLTGNFSGPDG